MIKKLLQACLLVVTAIVPLLAQAQSWSASGYAPHFRHINGVQILPTGRVVAVGGNPVNDAITSLIYSDDSAATWNIATDMVNAMLNDVHFPTATTGYAVGNAGLVYKTTNGGTSWTTLSLPGNLASRSYNGVFFFDANTGIVVGGNRSNDAIQTIIRTTDGGQSWSVITDNLGAWLLDVVFVNAATGYAVGDAGKVLRTNDAGLTWSVVPVPNSMSTRQFHGLHFFDTQTGVLVGGRPQNDSIQTILRTTDGGQNWSIISDNIAPMLKSVHFVTSTEGYAGGNNGTLRHTTDAGQTWTTLTIPGNDDNAVNDIFFINPAFGVAMGGYGKTLVYNNATVSPPTAQINTPVVIVNANTVQIQGQVNSNGGSTSIEFEYGTSPAFGTAVPMSPASTTTNQQQVSLNLPGLQPNTFYYGRIKATNAFGTGYSATVQFSTNLNAVPNFNFELWNTFSTESLQNWNTAGQVQKVASFDGSFAARAKAETSQEPGAILYANVGGNGIMPLPYAGRPDTLVFRARYDVAANDTALVVMFLHSNGAPIANVMHKLYGNSGGQFVQVRIPISYTSAAMPDSLALLFVSTNFFGGNVDPASELTIDNVVFTGTTAQLPNSNMEQWATLTRDEAVSWYSPNDMQAQLGDSLQVARTTDAYSGEYALLLRNTPATGSYAHVSTKPGFNNFTPDFPVQLRHTTFNGYYKFQSDANDTLFVMVTMFSQGVQVGHIYHPIAQSTNQFTLFSLPINYASGSIPDSAGIAFFIRKSGTGLPGESWAIIDNLSFDAVVQPLADEPLVLISAPQLQVYPNPAGQVVHLSLEGATGPAEVAIYDLTGRIVAQQNLQNGLQHHTPINISTLQPQVYFVRVTTKDQTFTGKFIKGL